MSNTFVPLLVEPTTATPFDGRLRGVQLGSLRITEVRATPHQVRRTSKLIARSDPEHCRHDLRDPLLADRPVGVIAADWGFVDPAHFSRVFRAAYGTTPQEYRHHPA